MDETPMKEAIFKSSRRCLRVVVYVLRAENALLKVLKEEKPKNVLEAACRFLLQWRG
jgi:hypothetical protein